MEQLSPHAEEIRARLEAYLVGKDFFFNPDPEIVDTIIKAMAARHDKFGKDYCPCRRVTGEQEKDDDIVCPCAYHLKEIEDDGFCHCRLFSRE